MSPKAYVTIGVCTFLCAGAVLCFDDSRAEVPLTQLQMVAGGTLNGDGTTSGTYGVGLRSRRTAPGKYEVTFLDPLTTTPVVYVIARARDDSAIASVTASSRKGFELQSPFAERAGIPDTKFNFAVGLRKAHGSQSKHTPAS